MDPVVSALTSEERTLLKLRALYRQYGYAQYRMSKFEEYDLYAGNKDFLVSENVLTFTDLNGKLMALKPDVTLSIVRGSPDRTDSVRKVFYNENVYRTAGSSRAFREIPQTGLECIGPIDDYCILEVLLLAAESLRRISDRCVLEISQLDILGALTEGLGVPEETRRKLLKCIGAKNLHELRALCREAGAEAEKAQQLEKLAAAGGCPEEVLPLLRALPCPKGAVKQLEALAEGFRAAGLEDMLRIDFSVVNDMQYYNGIVFRGFVYGVPAGVLSGGQYDRLMRKMGRSAGAIGFAVYLDELERIVPEDTTPDADVLLLYDEGVSPARVCRETRALTAAGKTVMAQQREPDRGVFGEVRRLTEKEDRDA